MFFRSFSGLASAIGLVLACTAHAQPKAPPGPPDPLDPKAQVPAAAYTSPFTGYRPAGNPQVGSWKDANDTVTRIGGWRAYAREASQPDAAASAPAPAAAPASAPASSPAGGKHHDQHKH